MAQNSRPLNPFGYKVARTIGDFEGFPVPIGPVLGPALTPEAMKAASQSMEVIACYEHRNLRSGRTGLLLAFMGGRVSYIADSASASPWEPQKQVCGVEVCDVVFHYAAQWGQHHLFIKDNGSRAMTAGELWRCAIASPIPPEGFWIGP